MINNIIKEVFTVLLRIVLIGVVVFAVVWSGQWAFDSAYELLAKEKDSDISVVDVELTIPQGSSTETIGNILQENGLVNNVMYFRIMAKLKGFDSRFQFGDYRLNTGMSEESIMEILATEGAKRETVQFTIPEGFTVEQVAARLSAEGLCSKEEFMNAIENVDYGYAFIDSIPDRNVKLQGYLFPSTYEVYADATAEDIVSTMLRAFDTVFKEEYYDRAQQLGLTVDEVITMASIIEKEVRVAEERELVAGVMYNRLDIDMPLQMCSTVMYVLDKPRDRLLYQDLEIESDYNTYMYPGLPVGPIANPGEASIKAALYPVEHDDLYFVLVDPDTGRHEFNATLNEHNAAKQKYNQPF